MPVIRWLALLLLLAACGASGDPEPKINLDPPEGTIAVTGEL